MKETRVFWEPVLRSTTENGMWSRRGKGGERSGGSKQWNSAIFKQKTKGTPGKEGINEGGGKMVGASIKLRIPHKEGSTQKETQTRK